VSIALSKNQYEHISSAALDRTSPDAVSMAEMPRASAARQTTSWNDHLLKHSGLIVSEAGVWFGRSADLTPCDQMQLAVS
jgi:hypothetical protein